MYGSPIKIWDPKGSQVIEAYIKSWAKEKGRVLGTQRGGRHFIGRRCLENKGCPIV